MTPAYYVPQAYNPPPAIGGDLDRRQGICLLYGRANLPDVDRLQAGWYYDYGVTAAFLPDPRYIAMSWQGEPIALPKDYRRPVLILNEPDNGGQAHLTPDIAAQRVLNLARLNPALPLVIGGPSMFGAAWLKQFVAALGDYRPFGWHVHGYCEWAFTAEEVVAWFQQARQTCPGGQFWITEYADTSTLNQAEKLNALVKGANWVDRYAWFANRIKEGEWFLPVHWENPALISADNTLTHLGKLYTGEKC